MYKTLVLGLKNTDGFGSPNDLNSLQLSVNSCNLLSFPFS